MPITFVQSVALASGSGVASQQTVAFGVNPTVGNYIGVWCWGWEATNHPTSGTIAASDTAGNSYSLQANAFRGIAADLYAYIGYAKVVTSGASFKVTATPTGSSQNSLMVTAAEFSGIAATSPEDGAAVGATGTSVTIAPGNLTLVAGSLVLGVSVDDNTTYGGSTPTGFNRVAFQNNGSSFEVGEAFYAIGPGSPSNPSRTITSNKWATSQLALLAAGGGGGGSPTEVQLESGLRGMNRGMTRGMAFNREDQLFIPDRRIIVPGCSFVSHRRFPRRKFLEKA